jgi:hypothetical protein
MAAVFTFTKERISSCNRYSASGSSCWYVRLYADTDAGAGV